ncbi:MAG: glycosyltransferase, partial [candidate division Zixibacteria bacterium]|nr:glycosyltransferase [candidate division Zixibacteria bacterium]
MSNKYKGKRIAWIGPFGGEHDYSHLIVKAMEDLGIDVVSIDYRSERNKLPLLAPYLEVDAVIINRGEWIDPELIRSFKVPTLLWYGEYIYGNDKDALTRRAEIEFNGSAFDYVIWEGGYEPKAFQTLRNWSCSNVDWVYPARIKPEVYRKLDVEKIYDVSFLGSITPRRKQMLDRIAKKFDLKVFTEFDLEKQVMIFNQTKVNLHISFADYPIHSAVNMRGFDVIGCGSFLLHEGLEEELMFKGGVHLDYFKINDISDLENKIAYYLDKEEERDRIAENGCKYLYENYSVEKTVLELLDKIDFSENEGKKSREEYGICYDKFGNETENPHRCENSCKIITRKDYPHSHHMYGARLSELGLYESAVESYKKAL